MRIAVDLASYTIIQAERTPEEGALTPYSGKFPVDVPISVTLNASSYVLPVDGGDVVSLSMAQLLAQFPMYSYVAFNPLLTASDMDDLDLTATFGSDVTRAMVGRGTGVLTSGVAPGSVCVLPVNAKVSPNRPGVLVSNTIDISADVPAGADEFLLWWKFYRWSTSEDTATEPAVRSLIETDSDASGVSVYVSNDDGATWHVAEYLTPTDVVTLGTNVRVAFVNNSADRIYVGGFACLY